MVSTALYAMAVGYETFYPQSILGLAASGSIALYRTVYYVQQAEAPLSLIAKAGGLSLSLCALVFIATHKIFDTLGLHEDCTRFLLEITFTLLYSLPIAFSSATQLGFVNSSWECLGHTVAMLNGILGTLFLATAIALAAYKIIRISQEHAYGPQAP